MQMNESTTTEESEYLKSITQAKLLNIQNLPSLPKVVMEVSRILKTKSNPNTELVETISKDHGLTAKILSISNSPLYGMHRKVASLEFAVLVLGHNEISRLVSSIALSNALQLNSSDYFKYEEYWNHSLMVGLASKELARLLGFMEIAADAFVGGMLHELGIQLMIKYFYFEFQKIVQSANFNGKNYSELEKQILGISHAEMGSFLAEEWNLPQELCYSIQFHHNPSSAPENKELVALIHLADFMTQKFQVRDFFWDKEYNFDSNIIEILGFESGGIFQSFIDEYEQNFIDNSRENN